MIFLLREECKYKTKCRERERERLWILLPARPALTERLAQLESAGSWATQTLPFQCTSFFLFSPFFFVSPRWPIAAATTNYISLFLSRVSNYCVISSAISPLFYVLAQWRQTLFFFSFCVCVDQIWKEMDSFATCWIHQPPLIIRNGNRISVSYYSEKGNHRLVIEHQLKDHEVESCTVISNMNCSLFRPTIIR